MTALLTAQNLSKAHGTKVLFENLSLSIHKNDRIALIGPNGTGKSTLLKILAKQELPDEGEVASSRDLRVAYAGQFPTFSEESVLRQLLGVAPSSCIDPETSAQVLLGKAQFTDFSQNTKTLSGGWKKRLDIARCLMQEPDLLLLDEPTNHLDLEGILWLEELLKRVQIPYLVISHDRRFLRAVATSIVEMNPCYPTGKFQVRGSYSDFLAQKERFLEGEEQRQKSLQNSVTQETAWMKKSPKARTTKSRSRMQKAEAMIDELALLKKRNKKERVSLGFVASERETRKLLTCVNLSKNLGGNHLFQGVDLTLSPGTRLGIVGQNGTGKSTLLKILAGELPSDSGTRKEADTLQIVTFDQHRTTLPEEWTLREALSPDGHTVNFRGQKIHVNGWAKRFLFPEDKLNMPLKFLSGGERARILIARLMQQPADILLLDEPTNDLDIPTLEVLEENLRTFEGAVVLITHDRALMENCCNQIVALGTDEENQHFAAYSQWEKGTQKQEIAKKKKESSKPKSSLSYKEKKELEGMEQAITTLEEKKYALEEKLSDESVQADFDKTEKICKEIAELDDQLTQLFTRWETLEKKSGMR